MRVDSIVWADLLLRQRSDGYRFNRDSVLLARTLPLLRGRGVDLGAGCGVLSLILLRQQRETTVPLPIIDAVEIQPALAALAVENAVANQFADYIKVTCADLRVFAADTRRAARYDFALCNPPYYPVGSGLLNRDPEKSIARHTLNGELEEFIAAAARLLKPKGGLFIVVPADLRRRVDAALAEHRFSSLRWRPVQSTAVEEPHLFLLQAQLDGPVTVETLPTYIYRDDQGRETAEMRQFFNVNAGA